MTITKIKTNINNSALNSWNKIKPGLSMLIIISSSIMLGFMLGVIKNKGDFDKAAIESGHAQYNKFSGRVEWRDCLR